jgi:hypothetical protein
LPRVAAPDAASPRDGERQQPAQLCDLLGLSSRQRREATQPLGLWPSGWLGSIAAIGCRFGTPLSRTLSYYPKCSRMLSKLAGKFRPGHEEPLGILPVGPEARNATGQVV